MNGIQFIVRQMEIRRRPPTTREEMRQRVIELRQSMSQRQVALELGVSRSTVFNLLHEALSTQEQGRP
jgi:transposase